MHCQCVVAYLLIAASYVYGAQNSLQIVSHRNMPGDLFLNASVVIDHFQESNLITTKCSYSTTPYLRSGYLVLKISQAEKSCMPVATHISGLTGTQWGLFLKVPLSKLDDPVYQVTACLNFEFLNQKAYVIEQGSNGTVPVPLCEESIYTHTCTVDGFETTTTACIGSTNVVPTTPTVPSVTSTSESTRLTSATTKSAATSTETAIPSPSTTSSLNITTTENNELITSTTPMMTTTLPFQIDCNNPKNDLEIVFCNVNDGSPISPQNISNIVNQTIDSFTPQNVTSDTLYMITGVIEKCSNVKNLTSENSVQIGGLVDKVFSGHASVFEEANSNNLKVGATLYDSVQKLLANSPSNVSFLNGDNWGFIVHPINCTGNADAGAMGSSGNGYHAGDVAHSVASIMVDGRAACSKQSTHVYYTMYRTSKLFAGSSTRSNGLIGGSFVMPNKANAATGDSNKQLPSGCQSGFLTTDGQVLAATAVNRTQTGQGNYSIIHTAVDENANIVKLRYRKKDIGVPLHGELKLTFWEVDNEQWSSNTCKVNREGDYYVSECVHLTDFTLIVDGISHDPILCDTTLIAVNLIVVISSIMSLMLLNTFIVMVFFMDKKGPLGKHIISYVPRYGRDSFAIVYYVALMIFFLIFLIFSNESATTGKHGCMTVAIINYWLLTFCIILSIFQSWIITKKFMWIMVLERILEKVTRPLFIYICCFSIPSVMVLVFGFATKGTFFYRNDNFCWIRSDETFIGVVVPSTLLVLNGCFSLFTMVVFLFPKLFPKQLVRGSSQNITKRDRIDTKERLVIIFLTQFTLGIPWLFQYFTLSLKKASFWHYLFAVINGAQGVVLLLAFAFRVYSERKDRNTLRRNYMTDHEEGEDSATKQFSRLYESENVQEAVKVKPVHHAPITRQTTLDVMFNENLKAAIQNEKIDAVKCGLPSSGSNSGRSSLNNNALDIGNGINFDNCSEVLVKSEELEQTPLRFVLLIRITSQAEPDYRLNLKKRHQIVDEIQDVHVLSDVPTELISDVEDISDGDSVDSTNPVSDGSVDLRRDSETASLPSNLEVLTQNFDEINDHGVVYDLVPGDELHGQQNVGISKNLIDENIIELQKTPSISESLQHDRQHDAEIACITEKSKELSDLDSFNSEHQEHQAEHEHNQQHEDENKLARTEEFSHNVTNVQSKHIHSAPNHDGHQALIRQTSIHSDSVELAETPRSSKFSENGLDSSGISHVEERPQTRRLPPKKPPRSFDYDSFDSFNELPVSATNQKFEKAAIAPDLLPSENNDIIVSSESNSSIC